MLNDMVMAHAKNLLARMAVARILKKIGTPEALNAVKKQGFNMLKRWE